MSPYVCVYIKGQNGFILCVHSLFISHFKTVALMSEVLRYIACVKYCTMNKGVMGVTVDKFDKSMWWRGWRSRGQGLPKWTSLKSVCGGGGGGGGRASQSGQDFNRSLWRRGQKWGRRSSLNTIEHVYVIGLLGPGGGVYK